MKPFKYHCVYCDKKYKMEPAFLRHTCDQQIRTEEAKTIRGQQAYEYYRQWNELRRYSVPPVNTFIESQHYLAFFRLLDFIKKYHIPEPSEYVKLMVTNKIMPSMWSDARAYKYYIEHVDKRLAPMKQVEITINTIFDLCEKHGIEDTTDFFDEMIPGEVLQAIVRRQLSPWFLYNSKKFRTHVAEDFSDHNRTALAAVHPTARWKEKFDNDKKLVDEIKNMAIELGL